MAATITPTTILLKPVNAVFEQTFLRRAQQLCPYFMGTVAGTLNKQQGTSTIKWRRIEQETPTTSALTELTSTASFMMGRNADTPTMTDVTATVSKFGQYYIVNEEVDLYNPNKTTNELVAVLGESAGRSLNQLMRDIMEDNATQRFAANVASVGAVHAIISTGDLKRSIVELTKNAARPFTAMTSGSQNIGSAPILPAYWGFCHPDVAVDIAGLTGFTSIEKYGQQTATVPGEFGTYSNAGVGVRFVQSQDASVDQGSGASHGAALSGADLYSTSSLTDVYATVIMGQDAVGSVGLGEQFSDGVYRAGDNTGGWEMIFHPRGSGGISDPFDEIGTLAWKAFFAGAILNSNFIRAIRTGATNLTN